MYKKRSTWLFSLGKGAHHRLRFKYLIISKVRLKVIKVLYSRQIRQLGAIYKEWLHEGNELFYVFVVLCYPRY